MNPAPYVMFQSSIARGRNFYPLTIPTYMVLVALFQSSIARGRNFYISLQCSGSRSQSFSPLSLEDAISTPGPAHIADPDTSVSVLYRSRTQFLLIHAHSSCVPSPRFSPLSLEDAISTLKLRPPFSTMKFQSSIARGRNFYLDNGNYFVVLSTVSVLYRSRTQFLQINDLTGEYANLFQSSIARGRNFYHCSQCAYPLATRVSVLYRSRTQFLRGTSFTPNVSPPQFQSSIARGRNFYAVYPGRYLISIAVSVLYRSRTQFLLGESKPRAKRPRFVSVLYRSRTQFLPDLIPQHIPPSPVSVLYRSRTQFLPGPDRLGFSRGLRFQSSIARGRNFYPATTAARTADTTLVSVLYRSRTQFLPQCLAGSQRWPGLFQSSIARGRNFYNERCGAGLRVLECFSPLSLEDAISTSSPNQIIARIPPVSVLYRSRTQFLHRLMPYAGYRPRVSVLYRSRTQFLQQTAA